MKRFLNSRGGTEVYIILIVILGAFLLAGGQFILTNIVTPPVEDPKGGPLLGGGGTGESASSSATWKIELVNGKVSCDTAVHKSLAQIAFYGTASGFYRIDVKRGNGYQPIYISGNVYNTFTPNTQNIQVNDLGLGNGDGFNTSEWRAVLFQGGSVSGTTLTGGTQKAEKVFPPTACT